MKQSLCVAAALSLFWLSVSAGDNKLNVCDFQDYEIGHVFKVWNVWGNDTQSTAVVEADPEGGDNKVLHVTSRNWNDYIQFELDESLAGPEFSVKYQTVNFSYRLHSNDNSTWKDFDALLGNDWLTNRNEFLDHGGLGAWKQLSFNLKDAPEENSSHTFALGFNSDNAEYYIDN
ncbi:MAG: hypothetical protein K2K72_00530, partial [Duncaniella sp.]|nr:hypothetical protein [Duncaniella sp.]